MTDRLREILEKVAAGELDPAAAEQQLKVLDEDPPRAPEPELPLRAVRVAGSFRTARIVGDPAVREAVADGQHTARREGDVLVIEADEHVAGEGHRSFRFHSERSKMNVTLGPGAKPLPLEVRMRPDLALDVTMAAGALRIDGVTGPIAANVSAGTISIDGFASPIDVSVAGGAVTATGRLDHGASKIHCDAGKVRVTLTEGSSVKVTGSAGLGKVELPGADAGAFIGGGRQESVIGAGEGTLEIEASLGLVSVHTA